MALSVQKKLDRLKKQIAVQQEIQRVDRLKTWYYVLVTPAAILACIYIDAYLKHTFISLKHLLLIGAAAGIPLSLPCLKLLRGYVLVLMFLIGGIFISLFLFVNQAYGDDKPIETVKRPAIDKHPRYKGFDAYITFRYDGNDEELKVKDSELNTANYITFTVKKGYFGYAFIDDYRISAE